MRQFFNGDASPGGVLTPDTRGVDIKELRRRWSIQIAKGMLTRNDVVYLEGMVKEDGSVRVPRRRGGRKGLNLMRNSFMLRLPDQGTRSLRW